MESVFKAATCLIDNESSPVAKMLSANLIMENVIKLIEFTNTCFPSIDRFR